MSKLAVFFPGIGYNLDKPLMYFSRDLAWQLGYEEKLLPYGNFPKKVPGDTDRIKKSIEIAYEQSREMLADVDFSSYEDILFVGKSIGEASPVILSPAQITLLKSMMSTKTYGS